MTYLYLNIIYFLELFIHKIKCKLTNCLADMSVDSMSDVKKTKLKYLALGSHMIDIKMMIDIKIFKMYAMKCTCLVLKFTYNWILFLTERGIDKGNAE